jgi:hypothetical protein
MEGLDEGFLESRARIKLRALEEILMADGKVSRPARILRKVLATSRASNGDVPKSIM